MTQLAVPTVLCCIITPPTSSIFLFERAWPHCLCEATGGGMLRSSGVAQAKPKHINRQAVIPTVSQPKLYRGKSNLSLQSSITIGIKHTSRFASRREKLELLLRSIRRQYPERLRVMVADDGGSPDKELMRSLSVRYIKLPSNAGLSHGRNALVQATRTPFIVMLDEDTLFDGGTSLATLHQTLRMHPNVAIAAGCYIDLRYPNHTHPCFRARFRVSEGGAVVQSQIVHTPHSTGCQRVHMATNFFMARTPVLRRFGWDPRQKVMEHETFYYQLYLNEQSVLACPNVTVQHNGSVGANSEYQSRSLRFKESSFMQYLCKNFPEIERFDTVYNQWRCDQRTFCQPAWGTEFAFDGENCRPMVWDEADDRSAMPRQLVSPVIHPPYLFAPRPGLPATTNAVNSNATAARHHTRLLVLILTQRANAERRSWQRATWLRFRWHEAQDSQTPVSWRHVYVQGRSTDPAEGQVLDVVQGDTVTLSAVTEGYGRLVYKTMEALRWAQSAASFDVVLKTDDDSMVHIGRLWVWLTRSAPRETAASDADGTGHNPWARLYAGRIQPRAQVIRSNFTERDLWHPENVKADFLKWAVPHEAYAPAGYPPYATGGGYLLGSATVASVLAAYDRLPKSRVIPIEDAQVGILAAGAGATLTGLDGFRELSFRDLAAETSLKNKSKTLHPALLRELKTALLLHRLPAAGPQRVFLAMVGSSHRCRSHIVSFGCPALARRR